MIRKISFANQIISLPPLHPPNKTIPFSIFMKENARNEKNQSEAKKKDQVKESIKFAPLPNHVIIFDSYQTCTFRMWAVWGPLPFQGTQDSAGVCLVECDA